MRPRKRAFGGSIVILATLGGCGSLLGLGEPDFAPGDDASTFFDVATSPDGQQAGEGGSSIDGTVSDGQPNDVDPDAASVVGILDTFDRPSASAVGNGWIEKTAGVFDLLDNAVELIASPSNAADALVYRPATEDVLNVSVGVTFIGDKEIGAPMLLARLHSPTAATPQSFTAYYATIPQSTPNVLQIVRRNGSSATVLAQKILGTTLAVKVSYRLNLRVFTNGPNVGVSAEIRELSSGALIGTISSNDGAADRIFMGGSVGFGATATLSSRTRFDDFARTSL